MAEIVEMLNYLGDYWVRAVLPKLCVATSALVCSENFKKLKKFAFTRKLHKMLEFASKNWQIWAIKIYFGVGFEAS